MNTEMNSTAASEKKAFLFVPGVTSMHTEGGLPEKSADLWERYGITLHQKIAIPVANGIEVHDIKDIIRVEADGNYSSVYLVTGTVLSARILKDFETALSDAGFVRVHHSHIINLIHLRKYDTKDGNMLLMSDGTEVPVSQRKRGHLLAVLDLIIV